MRRTTLVPLALALAGAAAAGVRSSSSYAMGKEVLSGGGGRTSTVAGAKAFSSFAQPQTGLVQSAGGAKARLGFLSGGDAPPSPPQNLTASPGDGRVALDWDDSGEPDLAGYNVYRSTAPGGPYARVNGETAAESGYTDTGLTNGTTYYYIVRAVGDGLRESADSNEARATPLGEGVLGGGCGSGAGAAALFALALLLRRRRSRA